MDFTFSEENYIKNIYRLSENGHVTTNNIAQITETKPASVSDMLKKLSAKGVINYTKYKNVSLTEEGKKIALFIVRKHRLWEVFLVEKLNFKWDEVHEVAEQLEHINSNLLIERLDEFLAFPRFDPHGDPIPDKNGDLFLLPQMPAADLLLGQSGKVLAVSDSSVLFLRYLDKIGIKIGSHIEVLDKIDYDGSTELSINNEKSLFVSKEVMKNLFVGKL